METHFYIIFLDGSLHFMLNSFLCVCMLLAQINYPLPKKDKRLLIGNDNLETLCHKIHFKEFINESNTELYHIGDRHMWRWSGEIGYLGLDL